MADFVCAGRDCGERFTVLKDYTKHLRLYHDQEGEVMTCDVGQCRQKRRLFKSCKALRNHLYAYHPLAFGTNENTSDTTSRTICGVEDQTVPEDCVHIPHDIHLNGAVTDGVTRDSRMDQDREEETAPSFKEMAALWILKLREVYKIPVSTVEKIIQDLNKLLEQILNNFSDSHETLFTILTAFSELKSIYMLEKYVKTLGYVEPKEIVLGERSLSRRRGKRRMKRKLKECLIYVPILDTIQSLCSSEVPIASQNNDGLLMDFCDGTYAKNSELFSNPKSLQIMIYYDDLELCNPLGSKKKVHKMGMFYFTLGNINPAKRSCLTNIYLVAIVRTSLIKKHGMNLVLQPIVNDLLKLESGCDFIVNKQIETLYGSVSIASADNPASCAIGGFKESASALSFCRHCFVTKVNDSQSQHFERQFVLREKTTHLQLCNALETADNPQTVSKKYGINFKSELLKLNYFDICCGALVPDVMHDILEGVLPMEMNYLLDHLIYKEEYFSLHDLNGILDEFEYGFMESSNKPSQIDSQCIRDSSERKLGQSASQMWLLGRLLPVMMGDLVHEDDPYWLNFLLLLKIVDFLFSPAITKEECVYLEVLINDHHIGFKKLYHFVKMTPKLHYMIHMPRIIREFGPLVRLWSMRFEAKHQYFKKLSVRTNNFINVAKTLAKRHQYLQLFYSKSPESHLEIGPNLGRVQEGQQTYESVKWVKINGTLIQIPCVLLWETGDFPTFLNIESILLSDSGIVCFSGQVFETEYYSEHYHCFVVFHSSIRGKLNCLSEYHPHPLHLRYLYALSSYVVVPKHHIAQI